MSDLALLHLAAWLAGFLLGWGAMLDILAARRATRAWPPADPPPAAANQWRGVVLNNGSVNSHLVPVKLPDGRLIDAKCKTAMQWTAVHTGVKAFGSIDADGKYIVEGIS